MRAALVDAAEQLIREEGYPAVTTRNLAEKLNLKRQIVHYYFHSMDDVFIAVIRKNAENMRSRLVHAAASDEPMRAIQVLNRDSSQAILSMELNALASHRPAVRAEVVLAAEDLRKQQTRILARQIKQTDDSPVMEPIVATVLLTSLAQTLAAEAAIDVHSGHKETLKFVEVCLRAFAEGRTTPFFAPLNKKKKSRRKRKQASGSPKSSRR